MTPEEMMTGFLAVATPMLALGVALEALMILIKKASTRA